MLSTTMHPRGVTYGCTRVSPFMYLTDLHENILQDILAKLEPDLYMRVTGPSVKGLHLLVRLKVFNNEQMNQAVFAFRRCEGAAPRFTEIESYEGLTHFGLYDAVVAREQERISENLDGGA